MKKLLWILVLGLLLTGCGATAGNESGTLGALIGFVAMIIITIILAPSMWLMRKAEEVKNPKLGLFLWIVVIISIIVILFNITNIFVFIGRAAGLGN